MWDELLFICLIGGFVALDTTAAWQVMFSQPIVTCPLLGLLLGDSQTGILIGLLMELLWLRELPIGASEFPESNVGSLVACAVAIILREKHPDHGNIVLILSTTYGLLVSYLGGKSIVLMRKNNLHLVHWADRSASLGQAKRVSFLHLVGVLHSFVNGVFLSGLSLMMGLLLIAQLTPLLPAQWDRGFALGKGALLGIGCGVVMSLFLRKKTRLPFTVGVVLGLVFIRFWPHL